MHVFPSWRHSEFIETLHFFRCREVGIWLMNQMVLSVLSHFPNQTLSDHFHGLIFQRNYSVVSSDYCCIFTVLVRPRVIRVFGPPPSDRKDRFQET